MKDNTNFYPTPVDYAKQMIKNTLDNLHDYNNFNDLVDRLYDDDNVRLPLTAADAKNFIVNNIDAAKETYDYVIDDLGNSVNPFTSPEEFSAYMVDNALHNIFKDELQVENYSETISPEKAQSITETLGLNNLDPIGAKCFCMVDSETLGEFFEVVDSVVKDVSASLLHCEYGYSLNDVLYDTDDNFYNSYEYSHESEEASMKFMFDNEEFFSHKFEDFVDMEQNPFEHIQQIESMAMTEGAFSLIEIVLEDSGIEPEPHGYMNEPQFVLNDEVFSIIDKISQNGHEAVLEETAERNNGVSLEEILSFAEEQAEHQDTDTKDSKMKDSIEL